MAEPFLAEIRIMSFSFPPRGWALCNGQLLLVNQNQGLFSLLGTTYGGDGQTNFALPNMQGRVPISVSNSHHLGEAAGSTSVTVNIQQLPTHLHGLQASATDGDVPVAFFNGAGNLPAREVDQVYGPPSNLSSLAATTVTSVGGSQPHNNMAPYLTLSFCIALQGIFPSRN